MNFAFRSGKNILKVKVKGVVYPSMSTGLMFRTRQTENLLFEFKKDVKLSLTSLFVFFPFLAVWLDGNNKVLGYRMVKPFSLSVNLGKPYRKLLEVPVNIKNAKLLSFFVEKHGKV